VFISSPDWLTDSTGPLLVRSTTGEQVVLPTPGENLQFSAHSNKSQSPDLTVINMNIKLVRRARVKPVQSSNQF